MQCAAGNSAVTVMPRGHAMIMRGIKYRLEKQSNLSWKGLFYRAMVEYK
jgi:hypothetical protein